jgi:hypothetical protein
MQKGRMEKETSLSDRESAAKKPETTTMRYEDLPPGNFFRIAARPEKEFFKCQPWVSTTADLEKMFLCKPDVMVTVKNPIWNEEISDDKL